MGNEEVLQHLSWRLLSPTHQPLRESGSIDGQRLQKAILHCNRHWQSAVRFTSFYLVLKAGNFKTNGSYWFMMFLLDCQVIFENSPALDSQPAKGNLPIGSELRRLASLFLNLPVNGWLLRGSNLWFFWVWGCLGALGPWGQGWSLVIERPPRSAEGCLLDQNMASVAWTNLKVTLATAKFFQESVAHPHGNPWKSHTQWPRVCLYFLPQEIAEMLSSALVRKKLDHQDRQLQFPIWPWLAKGNDACYLRQGLAMGWLLSWWSGGCTLYAYIIYIYTNGIYGIFLGYYLLLAPRVVWYLIGSILTLQLKRTTLFDFGGALVTCQRKPATKHWRIDENWTPLWSANIGRLSGGPWSEAAEHSHFFSPNCDL